VICGPNGTGKTTILEALVRTLFGFRRRRPRDRAAADARRPWIGDSFRATAGLIGPAGRTRFERDFDTDDVVVRVDTEERPVFEGEANLSGSGTNVRRYRALLQDVLGLSELDHYERTACVYQGALIETELNENLLRIAAGGHADIETAKASLRTEYSALTVDPITEGESTRRKPGEVEKVAQDVQRLEQRLAEARAAEARRTPLTREREELRTRRIAADGRISTLEQAFEHATELERLEAAREASLERLDQLEALARELDEALARVDLLGKQEPESVGRRYPADFAERVAVLGEGLWPRAQQLAVEHERLQRQLSVSPLPAPWRLAAGPAVALVLILVGVLVLEGFVLRSLALLLGAAAAGFAVRDAWGARTYRRDTAEATRVSKELAAVEERIAHKLDSVPDADTLTLQTLPDRRREFERQLASAREREAAESSLRHTMDRARDTLARVEASASESEVGEPQPSRSGARVAGSLTARARDLLERLHAAVSGERNERLAPTLLELRGVSRRHLELPDGVPGDVPGLRAALRDARDELRGLSEDLAALERRLAYEGRPDESSVALAARVEQRRRDLEEARERAAAYRHAFQLVTDAYDEFCQTDQDRLVDAVSSHLLSVTDGELGPLSVADGLDSAQLRAGARTLPMESPPLSYGQYHSAMFAIRLGAADFLAGLGVRVPLLIDDPFVHLDEERAAELWQVLQRIARQRQVVVATQDRLLLDYLGVKPDLELSRRPDAVRRQVDATPSGEAPAAGGSVHAAEAPPAPDLWSFLDESEP
jgi:DNA repair exonuclease SbcCD ATPase subunit